MQESRPSLNIVIPAYNEARRIAGTLREIDAWARTWTRRVELIVVDDGSVDGTAETARRIGDQLALPVRVLRYATNRGKGFALKVGFAASEGERVLFTDADLSTPMPCADVLLAALENADVAIGSRKMRGSRLLVRQPRLREWMGRVFTYIVRRMIADVSDVTCGFKAFRGDVGRDLFARCRISDWSFDAELLHIAQARGARIAEVPVEWSDREGTKVRLVRDALGSLLGLARIRWYAALGRYDAPGTHPPEAEELPADGVGERSPAPESGS